MAATANISTDTERPLKVLFISHDAHRGGAELFLLNIIRWIKASGGFEMQIVLARGGELEAEFEAQAPTWKIIGERIGRRNKLRRLLKRLTLRFDSSERSVFLTEAAARIGRVFRPDVIYANTVTVAHVVAQLVSLGAPVVTHAHELDYWIRYRLGEEGLSLLDRTTSHYIAVSAAVGESLKRARGVSSSRLTVIHGFIPKAARNTDGDPASRATFRAGLDIAESTVVVGACGPRTMSKGIDFFLAVAREVLNRKERPAIRFVWLGGGPSEMSWWIERDIECMGLKGHVQVLDARADPSPFFSAIDLFFLSSREDSFPLVCLEAASHAKPIVALAGAGGIAEFIRSDGGLITPYLDVTAASAAILRLATDPEQRRAMGEIAKARVAADHSPEVGVGRIVEVLRRVAERGGAAGTIGASAVSSTIS